MRQDAACWSPAPGSPRCWEATAGPDRCWPRRRTAIATACRPYGRATMPSALPGSEGCDSQPLPPSAAGWSAHRPVPPAGDPGYARAAAGTPGHRGNEARAGKCLDNNGGRTTDGNPVVLSTCDGSAEQQWTLQGDGTIRNQGHCLAVQHAGTTSMTPVWLYTCDGGPAQLWRTGSNHAVVNPNSGLCLADSHSATADGNPIWVYTCDGGPPSGGACRAWPPIRPVRRCRWGTSPDGRRSSRTTSPRTCRWAASRRRSPANGPPTPTGGPTPAATAPTSRPRPSASVTA